MAKTAGRHWIPTWDPEDRVAWEAGGKDIARRNLLWSVVAEHVGFSIWSIWSVMVLFMPTDVYHIDAAGKFFLVSVSTLVGSVLRVPYIVATAKFGGRNWTIFSALVLLVPTVATLVLMLNPGASFTTFLLVAGLAGFGGGNFSSSMTNINAFYPQRLKGWALGLNAGGGNIGVPLIQLIGLLVIASVSNRAPWIVCAVYLVACAVAALGAALFMDNLGNQRADLRAMLEALRYRDSWLLSFLYIGTFGSFIGFSFAFGQVLQINFLASGDTAAQASLHAAQIAFLGPLLGSLARPLGGRFADKIGGGRITTATFAAMVLAAGVLVIAGTVDDGSAGAPTGGIMVAYGGGFIALFLLSGVGNGSVYKMIPAVFEKKSHALTHLSRDEQQQWSRSISGALIGFAGAVGVLGGVGINMVLRASYAGAAHSATMAFWVFLGFYALSIGVTWLFFVKPAAEHHDEAAPAPAQLAPVAG